MTPVATPPSTRRRRRKPRPRGGQGAARSLWAEGEPLVFLTAAGVVLCLVMIVGLLGLVAWQGFTTFWPRPLLRVETVTGGVALGEVTREEEYRPTKEDLAALPEAAREAARGVLARTGGIARRRLLRTGNFELTGEHFRWISDLEIAPDGESLPEWAVLLERRTWGRFYGEPVAFLVDGEPTAESPETAWSAFLEHHDEVKKRFAEARRLEKHDIGRVNRRLEAARLELREVELEDGADSPRYRREAARFADLEARAKEEFAKLRRRIDELDRENARFALRVRTAAGRESDVALASIVRAYPANRLGFLEKCSVYASRWWEFLSAEPREANSEGGVFPAIFGTVVMTLLLCLFVVPFGVLGALYLREYARSGLVVSLVRIAVNNLAGVPSIVFGVFGLGFFCYFVGGTIDEVFFRARLPSPTYGTGGILWASLTLALLTLPVVIVATEEALAAVPVSMREGSFACGASKWQTIQRIVLPRAMPGIMTGMILAMARGAGEVAPLMLVGAVKLAPELPVDGVFPYIHPERSFMHLGFHIFDLGFQSQNSEAAKPMVYTTTLLLILIVVALNLAAIALRARLRRRFVASHF